MELANRFCDPYSSVNFTIITELFLDSMLLLRVKMTRTICRTKIRHSGISAEYSGSI